MNKKLIIGLICFIVLVVSITITVVVREKSSIYQKQKTHFCVNEIFRTIWSEQHLYGDKLDSYLGLNKLAELSKNKLLQRLTENIKNGVSTLCGYHFYIYLLSNESDISIYKNKEQKKNFICYAWPIKYGKTGFRAYAIDKQGWVYACGNNLQQYSGKKKPSVRACFLREKHRCNDGEHWGTAGTDAWISHSKAKKQGLFTCD
ncbi:hypothetical protein [Candidatus Uabimicrobium sp. HlEnr_7]|uniref:hypothetical protein n=1 Tax=Candidatus Uabimicrobium helgolandensis TaxID=3095367 RepID=UPI0035585A82